MGFPKNVIGLSALAAAASANAGILGYEGVNYIVVDNGRSYSVMDIYAKCSNQFDKCVSFYGQNVTSPANKNSYVVTTKNGVRNSNEATTATNGAPWVHSNGSGWLPTSAASGSAWDSFVTIGARNQTEAQTQSAITADPYFLNGSVSGAETIQGGRNSSGFYVGGGWYTASPLYPGNLAGSYTDFKIMFGRFTIDITDAAATDVITISMKGVSTWRVNGTSAGGGTTTQPIWSIEATYLVPAPGAIALVGLAGLVSRRRKA